MGGDNKTTTQNNESVTASATPYGPAKELLDTGMGHAMSNYNHIMSQQPWAQFLPEGAGVAAQQARQTMEWDPMNSVIGQFQNTYGQDGYNAAQRTAMQPMEATARGDYLDREDPNFERLLNRASERAATEASMTASGLGRTGSDFHQGLVTERVGDIEANARLGQYNTERDRQLAASGQLFGMGQTGMGNVANAGGIFESLYGARQAPANTLMQLGNAPSAQIADLLAAAQAGVPYATRTAQTTGSGSQTQPSNTAGKIAGGLLSGLSLLGGF